MDELTMTETLSNGRTINYRIVNGTAYHIDTAREIVDILENARQLRWRLRFHWGDVVTGLDWGDEYHVRGYVGRSMGPIKIPLLIYNRRSYGGGAILDHCIVKITTTRGGRVLYVHPSYHKGEE